MSQFNDPDEDEYEYEYEYEHDPDEVEVFLLDLDLSSLNGVMKPSTPGLRKHLQGPTKDNQVKVSAAGHEVSPADPSQPATVEDEPNTSAPTPTTSATGTEAVVDVSTTAIETDDIQMLDFHTHNPIVSYRNKIYSCTWSDMVGTNMFFSKHEEEPEEEVLRSTDAYDLLGISRIRLVGHQAKVTKKVNTKKRGRLTEVDGWADPEANEVEGGLPGSSLGQIRYTNPRTNAEIKKQARFLERLMNVKRTKGETDVVRTFVPAHDRSANIHRAARNQEELHQEIEQLNRQVVRGDADALDQLQSIYAELEEEPPIDSVSPTPAQPPEQPFPHVESPATPANAHTRPDG